jgi:hypothetical protein
VAQLKGRRCNPLFWRSFSYEKASKTSKLRDFLIYNFVNLSIPAGRTNRDVAEQIAKESHLPIDALPDDLSQPVFPRGQVISGFAGDELDKVADNYDNMQWWLSDAGLNMAIVNPATPSPFLPSFDDLMGRPGGEAIIPAVLLTSSDDSPGVQKRRSIRERRTDPTLTKLKEDVRTLGRQGLSQQEICDRLGNRPRPPRAAWRDRTWPTAYKQCAFRCGQMAVGGD